MAEKEFLKRVREELIAEVMKDEKISRKEAEKKVDLFY